MPINDFRFKQFTIQQQRAAMKVGTDGVLLGAWANLDCANRILDIGTGTGLLALMAAQRNANAVIDAIEIEENAIQDASQNIKNSSWANRMAIINSSLQAFITKTQYDYIISNPPFFTNAPKPEGITRTYARHDDVLSVACLSAFAKNHLTEKGVIGIIYPADCVNHVISTFKQDSLQLIRQCKVYPTPEKSAHRYMMEFSQSTRAVIEESMSIEQGGRHNYSDEYKRLTKAFYLNF